MIVAPSLNPGKLDRRITLRYAVIARNARGEAVKGWTDGDVVWGGRAPSQGREFFSSGAAWSDVSDVLRLRYRSDVTAAWRVLMGGRIYEVVSEPVEIGRREYIDLPVRLLPATESLAESARAFEVNLSVGVSEQAITYPTAFDTAPSALLVQLIVPTGGFSFGAQPVDSTRTASGFTVQLGAQVPDTGYKLSIFAVQ